MLHQPNPPGGYPCSQVPYTQETDVSLEFMAWMKYCVEEFHTVQPS